MPSTALPVYCLSVSLYHCLRCAILLPPHALPVPGTPGDAKTICFDFFLAHPQ